MHRRTLTGGLVLAAFAMPAIARAQSARKVARIALLNDGGTTSAMTGPDPQSPVTRAFLAGMRELGYVYGAQFVTEPRGADSRPERYPDLIADLIRSQVDVIVAGRASLPAVQQATRTIPVVMAPSDDPVGRGFVQSLAHPGGNFTGMSSQKRETIPKRLELLKELAPSATLVAILWDRVDPSQWRASEAAAGALKMKALSLGIQNSDEIEQAFRAAATARADALLALADGHLIRQSRLVAELANRYRLPALYGERFFVNDGGLASYAADTVDIWRRAAGFVDKILKGSKPADLPVEQPTKFVLTINLAAAGTIGLTVPQSILLRADAVLR